jgi:hypothetical protein
VCSSDLTRLVAEKYFSVCAAAIRKHDPNHMILGCRFAGSAPEIVDCPSRAVERLSRRIIHGFAGPREVHHDPVLVGPLVQGPGDKFAAWSSFGV